MKKKYTSTVCILEKLFSSSNLDELPIRGQERYGFPGLFVPSLKG